jgi:hypothetical protein
LEIVERYLPPLLVVVEAELGGSPQDDIDTR